MGCMQSGCSSRPLVAVPTEVPEPGRADARPAPVARTLSRKSQDGCGASVGQDAAGATAATPALPTLLPIRQRSYRGGPSQGDEKSTLKELTSHTTFEAGMAVLPGGSLRVDMAVASRPPWQDLGGAGLGAPTLAAVAVVEELAAVHGPLPKTSSLLGPHAGVALRQQPLYRPALPGDTIRRCTSSFSSEVSSDSDTIVASPCQQICCIYA